MKRRGADRIGLFQGMLKERGVALDLETDAAGQGPAHITLTDPDGNAILIDQHV